MKYIIEETHQVHWPSQIHISLQGNPGKIRKTCLFSVRFSLSTWSPHLHWKTVGVADQKDKTTSQRLLMHDDKIMLSWFQLYPSS